MKAMGLGLVLALVATAAAADPARAPLADAFHVTLEREGNPVAHRVTGNVHNGSPFRVTNVRVEIQGFDADRNAVGRIVVWAFGDIAPGGDSAFLFDAMPEATTYHLAVVSYDVVSRPSATERRLIYE
jgi:hypothetical protein